jgi:SAM-dependent methyltransferase
MGNIHDTDSEWKKWGKYDPYFAVLTTPKYRGGKNKQDFFDSGEKYFQRLIDDFSRLSIPLEKNGCALDYGCGVGRVLRPMSNYFNRTIGIDISSSMIAEAQKNCDSDKTDLRLFDEKYLSNCLLEKTYSFIHTVIVLQHIRTKRGMKIIEQLLLKLEKNGRALIAAPMMVNNKYKYIISQIRTVHPVLFKLSRLALGRSDWLEIPVTETNIYHAGSLISLFHRVGCEVRWIRLDDTSLTSTDSTINASWYLTKCKDN